MHKRIMFRVVLGVVSLIVTSQAAPGWMDQGYQEMMSSFGNMQPNFQKMNGLLGGKTAFQYADCFIGNAKKGLAKPNILNILNWIL